MASTHCSRPQYETPLWKEVPQRIDHIQLWDTLYVFPTCLLYHQVVITSHLSTFINFQHHWICMPLQDTAFANVSYCTSYWFPPNLLGIRLHQPIAFMNILPLVHTVTLDWCHDYTKGFHKLSRSFDLRFFLHYWCILLFSRTRYMPWFAPLEVRVPQLGNRCSNRSFRNQCQINFTTKGGAWVMWR